MCRLLITESEKKDILSLYETQYIDESVVVTDWLSPDEKYVIFLDELYNIETKTKLGNIWENFDNLKLFLKHSFEVSTLPKHIKENAQMILNNKLLNENTQNLNDLKSVTKILFNEGLLQNFKDWAVKTGKSTVDGFVDFAKKTYKGASSLIDKISKGEWKEVLNLLKQGVVYLFRKVRSALYHPVGMILDAILIATGIGKGAQMVAWGMVVALDVYEMVSGNYEEQLPMWQRLLFFGIDLLGFATTGGLAKAAKLLVKGKDLTTIAKSPAGKKLLTNVVESAQKAPDLLQKVVKFLTTRYPNGSKFISGILGKIGKFIESLINTIKQVIGAPGKILNKVIPGQTKLAKGTRAGVGTTALLGGIGAYEENKTEKEKQMMGGFDNVQFDFSKSL